jgi:pyruvate carboxylase
VRRAGAAAVAATLALLAGCGGSGGTSQPAVPAVRAALEDRLQGKELSFEWVYCLRTEWSYDGDRIFRCNVNFGEPHIVIYCVTFGDGELVTNREDPAIRCGRNAGP